MLSTPSIIQRICTTYSGETWYVHLHANGTRTELGSAVPLVPDSVREHSLFQDPAEGLITLLLCWSMFSLMYE